MRETVCLGGLIHAPTETTEWCDRIRRTRRHRPGVGGGGSLAERAEDQPERGGSARARAQQRLIISGRVGTKWVDLTRRVRLSCDRPGIAAVASDGLVSTRGDGVGEVVATVGGIEAKVPVRVLGSGGPHRVTFERDVEPILTRAGCNAGACHGKARGQNGFQLSLLGFDPDFDLDAIDPRGPRPPRLPGRARSRASCSCKATAAGPARRRPAARARRARPTRRSAAGSPPGCPGARPTPRTGQRIAVEPAERIMDPGDEQQLARHGPLLRRHDRGRDPPGRLPVERDAPSSRSTPTGWSRPGPIPGEAAITARFRGLFATCDVTHPAAGRRPGRASTTACPRPNFIDGLVWAKLQKLGITPSAPAGDATFLRRASLDVIGRLPTPDEARAFLADPAADKRARLVDRLLDRPEYADHWANKWVDLLRPEPLPRRDQGGLEPRRLDPRRLPARTCPTTSSSARSSRRRGSTFQRRRRRRSSATAASRRRSPPMVSQLFLGIRLECAKCHHHPFEVWGQERLLRVRRLLRPRRPQGDRPLAADLRRRGDRLHGQAGAVKHPLTGEVLPPKPLFGAAPVDDDPDADPREALARWMTAPENPYFARVIVNRVWADLMGRGIVEPVDDLRATNPPSNGPLLDALADDFRRHGYDLKHLIRTIMTSYGLRPRLRAERPERRRHPQLLAALPPAAAGRGPARRDRRRHRRPRDVRRRPARHARDDDLDPPRPLAVPRHLRPARPEPGPALRADDRHVGRPGPPPDERPRPARQDHRATTAAPPGWPTGDEPPGEIVEELYLLAYGRFPTDEERAVGVELFAERRAPSRRAGGRGPALGPAQLARIRLQGLIRAGRADRPSAKARPHERSTNCESMTRRDCLRLGLGGPDRRRPGRRPAAPRGRGGAARRPRPTSCILIWMDGGPSHYETFDPKPERPGRDPRQVRRRSPPRSPASSSRST